MWWVKTEDKFKFVKSCEAHIDDIALTVLPSCHDPSYVILPTVSA